METSLLRREEEREYLSKLLTSSQSAVVKLSTLTMKTSANKRLLAVVKLVTLTQKKHRRIHNAKIFLL